MSWIAHDPHPKDKEYTDQMSILPRFRNLALPREVYSVPLQFQQPFKDDPQICECVHAKSLQLCLTLWNPMDCSSPGSSLPGILQARILEWVAMPFSRGSSWPRDQNQVSCVSCIAGGFFTPWATWEEKCYRWPYLQSKHRDTDIENKYKDTKGGVWDGFGDWYIYVHYWYYV